jgi:hypothetical protein
LAIVRPDAKLRPASKSHWMNTPIRERTIWSTTWGNFTVLDLRSRTTRSLSCKRAFLQKPPGADSVISSLLNGWCWWFIFRKILQPAGGWASGKEIEDLKEGERRVICCTKRYFQRLLAIGIMTPSDSIFLYSARQ